VPSSTSHPCRLVTAVLLPCAVFTSALLDHKRHTSLHCVYALLCHHVLWRYVCPAQKWTPNIRIMLPCAPALHLLQGASCATPCVSSRLSASAQRHRAAVAARADRLCCSGPAAPQLAHLGPLCTRGCHLRAHALQGMTQQQYMYVTSQYDKSYIMLLCTVTAVHWLAQGQSCYWCVVPFT
jgi:hypothetical protein